MDEITQIIVLLRSLCEIDSSPTPDIQRTNIMVKLDSIVVWETDNAAHP